MREFIVSLAAAGLAALAWTFVWALALRLFGISYFVKLRTPEERAARRERLIRMGKWRYILLFGVLGWGFAFGLGMAVSGLVRHLRLVEAAVELFVMALLGGWVWGARIWNETVREEVPFPPLWLSKK